MEEVFIEIKDLHKTFYSTNQNIEVLKGINLKITKGDIFGIVGFSGAGKSTLVRCLNRLEEPDKGSIRIGQQEMTKLTKRELNIQRQKIGMIFQSFNLFESKTVYQNVAYPLKLSQYEKRQMKERVKEILELVGLSDKIHAYPGQLSGGQKQRVGIARALANNPDVLLSDEATSALDPQTTVSVLDLLKEINQKLGITIILITHELEAIKYICNNMAILEQGEITEQGTVREVFLNPHSHTGKLFIKIHSEFQQKQWVEEGEGI
ncbi:ABC transporter [Sporanaerobium hydrogeniformans]|uniref:ABC transporter n=1 Tax=Sporanaerobium hydrogeniformans TaxID=3072179 RepID=A0AC61DD21_9FIRM|nr:methionine ABC transporter ATP-binding protein [Sporanaerobium hydrogeniformans]PHV70536.1 ABC transporter [Sporanaerobium hydrogeniformans]